jgi:glycine betaine/proline transport system ATP-binding protein
MDLSGFGKSTLVRLNRPIDPTAGKIFISDDEITTADPPLLREIRRRKIAMVFHPFSLFPHSSIVVNAASGLRVQGVPADEHRERAMAVLERSSTGTSKSLAGKSSG